MLAHEAHHLGEPCWHVCQYYDHLRAKHKAKALKQPKARHPAHVWHDLKRKEARAEAATLKTVKNPVRDALMIDRAAYKKGYV